MLSLSFRLLVVVAAHKLLAFGLSIHRLSFGFRLLVVVAAHKLLAFGLSFYRLDLSFGLIVIKLLILNRLFIPGRRSEGSFVSLSRGIFTRSYSCMFS